MLLMLLPACDRAPSYWKWACDSDRESEILQCEMSKNIPLFRSAEHLQGFDLCEPKTEYYEQTTAISWAAIENMGAYVAIGGYCDFRSRYDSVLDYLEEEGSMFEGMLFQVHSCVPKHYLDLNLRAENLGLSVTSYQLDEC